MALVINYVPFEQLVSTLQSFVLSIIQRLHAISIQPSRDIDIIKETRELVDKLGIFVKYVNPNIPDSRQHPIVALLTEIWPLLSTILDIFPNTPIVESITRIIRSAIDNTVLHLSPLVPQLISKMINGFSSTNESSYLWMAKKFVECYASDTSNGNDLSQVIDELGLLAISIFKNTPFDEKPDVVEDYFVLMSCFLLNCPNRSSHLTCLVDVVRMGVAATLMENQTALNSVVCFFEDLIDIISVRGQCQTISVENKSLLNSRIASELSGVLACLFHGMMDTFPKDRDIVKDVGRCIYHICLTGDMRKEMYGLLAQTSTEKVTLEERNVLFVALESSLNSLNENEFKKKLTQMANTAARRSRK